jgi:hypothetical protein
MLNSKDSIPVAIWSKTWDFDRLLPGIVGLKPARDVEASVL